MSAHRGTTLALNCASLLAGACGSCFNSKNRAEPMKRLQQRVFITFLALGIAPVCGADEPPSVKKLGLKGYVRRVIENELADNISPLEPKGTSFQTRTTYFSPDGSVLLLEDCVSVCEHTEFFWQLGRLVEER